MSKAAQPELKKVSPCCLGSFVLTRPQFYFYMDKKLFLNLQGNRKLSGVLRGFDIFLNLVLDEAQEESLEGGEKRKMGLIVIRGNSVSSIETLEAVR
ncbi:small nuclear ribonucleoprotein G [Puccinia sorghi]|uniref:Small nuclear ribonucleoprotein G n=1 Tax=Puccinia sorghi TaxID=27349 RepID=A0A0L6URE6_9BASI|nr:small nuclear ribonucleoprotein G [Puccinia sorghi]